MACAKRKEPVVSGSSPDSVQGPFRKRPAPDRQRNSSEDSSQNGGCAKVVDEGGVSSSGGTTVNVSWAAGMQSRRVLPTEVVGVVDIPDHWPGEVHLRDWVETKQVENGLRPRGLMRAREAMVRDSLGLARASALHLKQAQSASASA